MAGMRIGLAAADAAIRSRLEDALGEVSTATSTAHRAEELDGELDVVVLHLPLASEADRLGELRTAHSDWGRIIVCSPPAGARGVRKAVEQGADGLVWEAQIEGTLRSEERRGG